MIRRPPKSPLFPSPTLFRSVFEDGRKKEHTALVKGKLSRGKPALARIHSQCLTGDTLGSTKCDCGLQLRAALGMIGKQGGVLVYLQQEGRGIGLANKIKEIG